MEWRYIGGGCGQETEEEMVRMKLESTHWLLTVRGAKKSDLRQTLGTARGETFREIGELHVQPTGVIIVIITERMHVSL